MNERIKELAKQSLPEFYLTNCPSALEKFAELIVLECADFVAQNTLEDQGMWGKIVRHFGVEE
jgi:hypothetical protein